MATNQEKLDLAHDRAKKYIDSPVSSVPAKVWAETVRRGGQDISVKQELADAKSGVQRLEAAVAALTSLVGQLAKGESVDYERIQNDTREVLAQETVNVEVTVNEKAAA
jgi:hypothetical protein